MRSVLLTGGMGFVGQVLVRDLIDRGYYVRVLDNGRTGKERLLPNSVEFMLGDVMNYDDVWAAWTDMDACIHMASVVGFPACADNPTLAREVHVEGTRNVIVHAKTRRVVATQTGSQYGAVPEVCTEESEQRPITVYGETKKEGERVLLKGINTISLRYATAFGVSICPRHDLLVNFLCKTAVEKGHLSVFESDAMRTFIHVKDFSRSLIHFLELKSPKYRVYNCGDDALNVSKKGVCELVKAATGCTVDYDGEGEDPDKRSYYVNYSRIQEEGFRTSISLEAGIDELVQYYKGAK